MTIKIKIIIGLVLVMAFGIMAFNIKILNDNVNVLTDKNTALNAQVNEQKQQIIDIQNSVKINSEIIKNFNDKSLDIDNKYNKLDQKLNSHDIEKIAKKKPQMLEKVLNNSFKEQIKRIEEKTTRDNK